eukprot:10700555-Alexandrium_andersonii.AAC.1
MCIRDSCTGPGKGIKIGPLSSRGVRSATSFVQTPNPPTKGGLEGVRRREVAKSPAPIRNPPTRGPR